MKPRILLLGGTEAATRKAADCGLDVVNIDKPALFDPAARAHCVQTHLVDYQDISLVTALARALHAHRPFRRVVSQTEAGPLVAGHLTTALGLPGTGAATARLVHDKAALRALLTARGISPVAFQVGASHSVLRAFAERHGALVVKPTMASGSLGVRKVRSPREVPEALAWLADFGVGEFMVEELLTGTEISVESFSVAGRHTVLAVSRKDNGGGVVALGHALPAPLSAECAAEVDDVVCRMLDAVGLIDGPAHTELILTADGPRVVESHLRCAGGRIGELVELVHGIDTERLTCQLALPDGVPELAPAARGGAAVRFLTPRPGRVRTVEGLAAARRAAGVVRAEVGVEPGALVEPLRWSEDRCGFVVARAGDAVTAERRARQAAALIRIHTEPLPAGPTTTMRDLLTAADEVLDPFGATAPQLFAPVRNHG
ncbi:ATP-grasp domain-containing protein [Streptomyces sp. NPDC088801]|uniref:ATP-grasp domain-containing protein n=1 Tax=Streptomyces sp. NPDC088801 TaxID=3365903 RepID=UPI003829C3AD